MKYIYGNVIKELNNNNYNVLINWCDCFNNMDIDIRRIIPPSYFKENLHLIGDSHKLGRYDYVIMQYNNNRLIIINSFIQYDFTQIESCLNFIDSIFSTLLKIYINKSDKILIPRFNIFEWNNIFKIIDKHFNLLDYTIIEGQNDENSKW